MIRFLESLPTPFPPLSSAHCLYFTVFLCIPGQDHADRRRGWARSQLIQPREKPDPPQIIQYSLLFRLPAAVQQVGAEGGITVEQVLAEVDDQLVRVPQGRLYYRPVRHSSVTRDCACATHREMIQMVDNPGSFFLAVLQYCTLRLTDSYCFDARFCLYK